MLVLLGLLGLTATLVSLDVAIGGDGDASANPPEDDEFDDSHGIEEKLSDIQSDGLLGGLPTEDTSNGTIYGGEGDDTLRGGNEERDELFGGPGNDLLINGQISTSGFTEVDALGGYYENRISYHDGGTLYGGEGNDTIFVAAGDGYGGEGDDSLSNFDAALIASPLDDVHESQSGIIRINDVGTNNSLFGGGGNDEILSVGVDAFGEAGEDTIFGSGFDRFEEATGQPFTSQNAILSGGEGNDVIYGLASDVYGDAGEDLLDGRFSDLFGGDGDDTILAFGAGLDEGDSLVFDGGDGNDIIAAIDGAYTSIDGESLIKLIGGNGDDLIDARVNSDQIVIEGGEGNDTILAEARNDVTNGDSFEALTTVKDFNPNEDVLIIEIPVKPVSESQVTETPADLRLEALLVEISGEIGTMIKISINPESGFDLAQAVNSNATVNYLDQQARYVLLEGISPSEVDLGDIYARAIFDGHIVSHEDFPEVGDDPALPTVLSNLPSTEFEEIPGLLYVIE